MSNDRDVPVAGTRPSTGSLDDSSGDLTSGRGQAAWVLAGIAAILLIGAVLTVLFRGGARSSDEFADIGETPATPTTAHQAVVASPSATADVAATATANDTPQP
jgi:hypothetical protein